MSDYGKGRVLIDELTLREQFLIRVKNGFKHFVAFNPAFIAYPLTDTCIRTITISMPQCQLIATTIR